MKLKFKEQMYVKKNDAIEKPKNKSESFKSESS